MSGAERRREPRFPLKASVVVLGRGRSVRGRVVDGSATGLLIELVEPLSFLADHVDLEITLSGGEIAKLEADVIRRAISETGMILLALRLAPAATGPELKRFGVRPIRRYGRRVQPSRAKPREPRTAAEARRELHALGSRVLELALIDPDGRPPRAMTRWVIRLADELGGEVLVAGTTNRLLLRDIAGLHRTTAAAAA